MFLPPTALDEIQGTAAARVIEILHQKEPNLVQHAPLIIALCELYHIRRTTKSSAQPERPNHFLEEVL